MERRVGHGRIEVVHGDITKEFVDIIVNAANSSLNGGGGVDGAIHRVGGPAILEECERLGGCDTGDAKITTAGNLMAQFVVHTVGPIYHSEGGDEARLLAQCYTRCLEMARKAGGQSVAFPAISCGVYGYPVEEAAPIAIEAVADFLRDHDGIELVRFVLFNEEAHEAFVDALEHSERS